MGEDGTNLARHRLGEKIGWIGGWIGGLAWILALAGVLFYQGEPGRALSGALLFALGALLVWYLAPWRWPDTRYWRLLLPPMTLLAAAAAWAIWAFGGWAASGLSAWNALLILPVLSPLATIGWRRWSDGE